MTSGPNKATSQCGVQQVLQRRRQF